MKRIVLLFLSVALLGASCKKDDKTENRPEPVASSVSPVRGRAGTVITVSGGNFSRLRVENIVKINGVEARIVTFNEEKIHVVVPGSETVGSVPVTVIVAGKEVAAPSFEYMEPITPYTTETFAGDGTASFAEGTGTAAKFNNPEGVAIDSKGNIIVADRSNHRIRKIAPNGEVTTLAGSGSSGRVDGPAATARFNSPWKVAVDKHDNIIVADRSNHCIRKISADGVVTTIAGNGSAGNADGMGSAARFNWPQDVEVDDNDNIYVVDYNNHRICKITPDGMVSTLAGSTSGYEDGTGTAAKFAAPTGLVLDRDGNLLITDRNNHRIRKISPDGVVTTFAGTGTKGVSDGELGEALFSDPYGICIDATGNVYVADLGHAIRKITIYGEVITIGGNGAGGFADGSTPLDVRFNQPTDVAVDSQGRVYVADLGNHRIRRLIPAP